MFSDKLNPYFRSEGTFDYPGNDVQRFEITLCVLSADFSHDLISKELEEMNVVNYKYDNEDEKIDSLAVSCIHYINIILHYEIAENTLYTIKNS